jgi:magnesium transporter
LGDQSTYILIPVWRQLAPDLADKLLLQLPENSAIELLTTIEASQSVSMLSRFDDAKREYYLGLLDPEVATELRELLAYPTDSAGSLMDTDIIAFNENLTVEAAIKQLKNLRKKELYHLSLLNDDGYLQGQVSIQKIALVDENELLSSLSTPLLAIVSALDPKSEVTEKLEKLKNRFASSYRW